jgi:sugar lactone lactonase YvrE
MPRHRALSLSALLSVTTLSLGAQSAPTNDAPNPYRTVVGWAKLPEGRTWGSTSAVDIAKDGKHIWVAERCGANSCIGSSLDPVMLFDANGTIVRSFGTGLIQSPHGIHVDRDGNVWVTDCSCTGGQRPLDPNAPKATPTGHQIFKFSPEGTLLMTLGAAGGARDTAFFWQPNDVITNARGEIFVAEGHSSRAGQATARLLKFDRNGKLLASFGKWGKGKGADEFDQPHALAFDSKGRLLVSDRGNDRIRIYSQDFALIETLQQFSRASGLWVDKNDVLYATDSESGSVAPDHVAWKRGIRIGSLRDGVISAFIPDPDEKPASTSAAEGVAVDAAGNIYGAEVGPRALKKYVKP